MPRYQLQRHRTNGGPGRNVNYIMNQLRYRAMRRKRLLKNAFRALRLMRLQGRSAFNYSRSRQYGARFARVSKKFK